MHSQVLCPAHKYFITITSIHCSRSFCYINRDLHFDLLVQYTKETSFGTTNLCVKYCFECRVQSRQLASPSLYVSEYELPILWRCSVWAALLTVFRFCLLSYSVDQKACLWSHFDAATRRTWRQSLPTTKLCLDIQRSPLWKLVNP